MELQQVVTEYKRLAELERTLYLNAVNQLNSKMRELMNPANFGRELLNSCVHDLSGEVIRNYFDTNDYAITVDQMGRRVLNFSYDNEYDPLASDEQYRKNVYNYSDYASSTLRSIVNRSKDSTVQMFPDKRESEPYYDKDGNRWGSRTAYKNREPETTTMTDDLTNKEVRKETIDGDHVRAVKAAEYNARYLDSDYVSDMSKVYNSDTNMQWIDARANRSKGDAATTEETVRKWENTTGETRQHLQDKGYLNEEGKVPKHVKKQLDANFRRIGNRESIEALKHAKYKTVTKDALVESGKVVHKILAGQLIYYTLPPLVHEAKGIMGNKPTSISDFFEALKQAMKRVGRYVGSKMKTILSSASHNLIKKFVKSFFDILLSILKDTVKKAVSLVKNLLLAVVDSAKILFDKNATRAQKADGVFNLVSVTITSFVVDALLEYAQRQFQLPAFVVEPLQMIATVLTSNVVMLILQKADLFDVRHGLLVANIEQVMSRTEEEYLTRITDAETVTNERVQDLLATAQQASHSIKNNLLKANLFEESVQEDLHRMNVLFHMGIDFGQEWATYIGLGEGERKTATA